jgi:hypothetical protein
MNEALLNKLRDLVDFCLDEHNAGRLTHPSDCFVASLAASINSAYLMGNTAALKAAAKVLIEECKK